MFLESTSNRARLWCLWIALTCATACADDAVPLGPNPDPLPGSDTVRVPLTDMGGRTYRGFPGGLYPGGNALDGAHLAAGMIRSSRIKPLDANGQASANGRYVLLSIGMSNTTQEFCSGPVTNCATWSFAGQASADAGVNHTTLAIVDGARGGQTADTFDSPTDPNYDLIRDQRLAARGVTERQVQVVWMKVAHSQPRRALPDADADARVLARRMADIARALKVRYPNLQQVFASSRIYAGYATTTLNPEPYAFESGFAVKWVIETQIAQIASGAAAAGEYGDMSYERGAPWMAWGPYLWADGSVPRSDGLFWLVSDLQNDGTHPSQSGQQKVGRELLQFFKTSPVTRCWFLASAGC